MGSPNILIAGIGNIFLGDDAFGVEVARRLAEVRFGRNVRVVDYGVRGHDLVYAFFDDYELAILVDSLPQGKAPGSLSVIVPRIDEADDRRSEFHVDHSLDVKPLRVLKIANSVGARLDRVVVVGCEPETFGSRFARGSERMGLSLAVETAVDEAVAVIKSLVRGFSDGRMVSSDWKDHVPAKGETANGKLYQTG